MPVALAGRQDGRTEGAGGRGYDKECRGAGDARVGLKRSVSPPHLPTAGGTAAPSGPALTWEGGRQPAWRPWVPISTTCSESVTKGGFSPRVCCGAAQSFGRRACERGQSARASARCSVPAAACPAALWAAGPSPACPQLCRPQGAQPLSSSVSTRMWVFLFTEQGRFLGVALTSCWLGRLDSSLSWCQRHHFLLRPSHLGCLSGLDIGVAHGEPGKDLRSAAGSAYHSDVL